MSWSWIDCFGVTWEDYWVVSCWGIDCIWVLLGWINCQCILLWAGIGCLPSFLTFTSCGRALLFIKRFSKKNQKFFSSRIRLARTIRFWTNVRKRSLGQTPTRLLRRMNLSIITTLRFGFFSFLFFGMGDCLWVGWGVERLFCWGD